VRSRSALAALCLIAAGCTEDLENAVGCPALCPEQSVEILTITIEPVVLDTTVIALVAPGATDSMFLARRGDTVDSRVIVRFDSLPQRFRPSTTDTTTQPITTVTTSTLRLVLSTDGGKLADPTTIEAFNVDTSAADTAFAALLPLFRSDRAIGGKAFTVAELTDTIAVPLSDSAVLATVRDGRRLRIGLRVSGPTAVEFVVLSSDAGTPPQLTFRPSTDTTVALLTVQPISATPESPTELREDLRDYHIFALAPPAGPPTQLNVGGLPARRSYLRFDIPLSITDSTTVVRATLLLTQNPNRTFAVTDTMAVVANLVVAGSVITDIARAATLVLDPLFSAGDTLRVVPADTGIRELDIAGFLRNWRGLDRDQVPHALVLNSTRANISPLEATFFSIEAAPSLRPRLRISYSPRSPVGLP
jgi:hypothetical protein